MLIISIVKPIDFAYSARDIARWVLPAPVGPTMQRIGGLEIGCVG
jgi:hypothetical protein